MKSFNIDIKENEKRKKKKRKKEKREKKPKKEKNCSQDRVFIPHDVDAYLGSGATGEVWMACCEEDCGFAIKVIYLNNEKRFEREAIISYYAGEYLKIGPNIYDNFVGKLKGVCNYDAGKCGYIVADRLIKQINNVFEDGISYKTQYKYYKRIISIVKKLSQNYLVNEDPNHGNWMVDENDNLYLIDYDQVVQLKDSVSVIYYYNLTKIKHHLFDMLDFHKEIVDEFKDEMDNAFKTARRKNNKLSQRLKEMKEEIRLLLLDQQIEDIDLLEL